MCESGPDRFWVEDIFCIFVFNLYLEDLWTHYSPIWAHTYTQAHRHTHTHTYAHIHTRSYTHTHPSSPAILNQETETSQLKTPVCSATGEGEGGERSVY